LPGRENKLIALLGLAWHTLCSEQRVAMLLIHINMKAPARELS
jgi:hypothetical protein